MGEELVNESKINANPLNDIGDSVLSIPLDDSQQQNVDFFADKEPDSPDKNFNEESQFKNF